MQKKLCGACGTLSQSIIMAVSNPNGYSRPLCKMQIGETQPLIAVDMHHIIVLFLKQSLKAFIIREYSAGTSGQGQYRHAQCLNFSCKDTLSQFLHHQIHAGRGEIQLREQIENYLFNPPRFPGLAKDTNFFHRLQSFFLLHLRKRKEFFMNIIILIISYNYKYNTPFFLTLQPFSQNRFMKLREPLI